jgi:hypothetical protein
VPRSANRSVAELDSGGVERSGIICVELELYNSGSDSYVTNAKAVEK